MIRLETTQTHIAKLLTGVITYTDFQAGTGATPQADDETLTSFLASFPIIDLILKRTTLGDDENSDTALYDINLSSIPNLPQTITEFALMAMDSEGNTYVAMYGFDEEGFYVSDSVAGNLSGMGKMLVQTTQNVMLGVQGIPFTLFNDHITRTPESIPDGVHGIIKNADGRIEVGGTVIANLEDLPEDSGIGDVIWGDDTTSEVLPIVLGDKLSGEIHQSNLTIADLKALIPTAGARGHNFLSNPAFKIYQKPRTAATTSTTVSWALGANRWQYQNHRNQDSSPYYYHHAMNYNTPFGSGMMLFMNYQSAASTLPNNGSGIADSAYTRMLRQETNYLNEYLQAVPSDTKFTLSALVLDFNDNNLDNIITLNDSPTLISVTKTASQILATGNNPIVGYPSTRCDFGVTSTGYTHIALDRNTICLWMQITQSDKFEGFCSYNHTLETLDCLRFFVGDFLVGFSMYNGFGTNASVGNAVFRSAFPVEMQRTPAVTVTASYISPGSTITTFAANSRNLAVTVQTQANTGLDWNRTLNLDAETYT